MSLETLPPVKLIELAHPHPADKQAAVDWARLLMQRNDWVILDTETTGLDENSEVIQIAILSPDNEVLLNTYVKPMHVMQIPAEATAVHGININMLAEAPTITDLLPKLERLLQGKLIVCYNASFDMRLLKQTIAMSPAGENDMRLQSDCAMVAYSKFAGEWLDSKFDYKWQKLPSGDHSALGDCRATLAVVCQMADSPQIIEAVEMPVVAPTITMPTVTSPAQAQPKPLAVKSLAVPFSKAPWLILSCVVLAISGLLLSGVWSYKFELSSPSSDVHLEAPPAVPSTVPEALAGDSEMMHALKAWNPITLPDDLKATFFTSLHQPSGIDFELYLSGPANVTQAILDQGAPANLHLLDKEGKTIAGLNVAGRQWLRDRQGNLVVKDSVQCSASDYAKMSAWEIQLKLVKAEPAASAESTVEASISTSAPTAALTPTPSLTPSLTPTESKPPVVRSAQAPPLAPNIPKRPAIPGGSQPLPARPNTSTPSERAQRSQTASDRFSRMEQEVFGSPNSELPAPQRLERLEIAVFRVSHPQDSIAVRLERLQRTLFGE